VVVPQPIGGSCSGGCPTAARRDRLGGRSAMACSLSLAAERGDSTMPTEASRSTSCADMPRLPNHPELLSAGSSLAGELLQRLAQRVRRLVTAGSGALADRAAFRVMTIGRGRPVGVDPDGVAAVAGRPEPVLPVVLALVPHFAMWRDRIFRPSIVRFTEAEKPRRIARWGRREAARPRSIVVSHGVRAEVGVPGSGGL
jgi:hypothetical protein